MLQTTERLSEFILRPIEERTAHLDPRFEFDPEALTTKLDGVPSDECWTNQGRPKWDQFLPSHVQDDVKNKRKAKITRIHVCQCDSTNGWCQNPTHSFIGTPSENSRMVVTAGNHNWSGGGFSPYKNPEQPSEIRRMTAEEAARKGWIHNRSGKTEPDERTSCSVCGLVGGKGQIKRWHDENCAERVGSERWFAEQLKEWNPSWKRRKDPRRWRHI